MQLSVLATPAETIGLHDRHIILLVSLQKFMWHNFIECNKGTIGIQCSCIEDCLCGLLNLCPLSIGRIAPREIVVDDFC